jgi:hypothetical protein
VTAVAAGPVPGTARVEAFSDAVIAVAATLLVLELRPPEGDEGVWPVLRDQLPSLAAYAVSFLTILIFWAARPELVAAGARADRAALVRSLAGPGLYGVAALVALVSAPVSLVVDAVVAAYFMLPPRRSRRPARAAGA